MCPALLVRPGDLPPMAQTPYRRSPPPMAIKTPPTKPCSTEADPGVVSCSFNLLAGMAPSIRLRPPILPVSFQGVTILGLQRVCTDKICPTCWLGDPTCGSEGEARGHATKVTDVLRKRVVVWWGQYGEKLDETNSDLTSAREKDK